MNLALKRRPWHRLWWGLWWLSLAFGVALCGLSLVDWWQGVRPLGHLFSPVVSTVVVLLNPPS